VSTATLSGELRLYIGKRFTGITVVPDDSWPGMWRVRNGDCLSDMVNRHSRPPRRSRNWRSVALALVRRGAAHRFRSNQQAHSRQRHRFTDSHTQSNEICPLELDTDIKSKNLIRFVCIWLIAGSL
jgi:hypothetical protein